GPPRLDVTPLESAHFPEASRACHPSRRSPRHEPTSPGGTRVQTDQSIDSATATSRRTFLTRSAIGGALVTAGALALPHTGLIPAAGARPGEQGDLKDPDFAAFGTAIELAAVSAYSAAF